MAEGFATYYGGAQIIVESAGTATASIDPFCQWAMNEAGIDIALQSPETLEDKDLGSYDRIIALGGEVPSLSSTSQVEHWEIPDPAAVRSGAQGRIQSYRAVRNQIETKVKKLLAELL
jgi:arsenate reductase